MQKLNPAWVAHNNLYNEGGEGYNPHPKYIAAAAATFVAPSSKKMIAGKARAREEALKFARNCLSGAQKDAFLAQVAAAWPEA